MCKTAPSVSQVRSKDNSNENIIEWNWKCIIINILDCKYVWLIVLGAADILRWVRTGDWVQEASRELPCLQEGWWAGYGILRMET